MNAPDEIAALRARVATLERDMVALRDLGFHLLMFAIYNVAAHKTTLPPGEDQKWADWMDEEYEAASESLSRVTKRFDDGSPRNG